MEVANLFDNVPTSAEDELVSILAESTAVRVERIVSCGHASPDGFWYDQDEYEWVAVLKGDATIVFEDEPAGVTMRAGDHLLIPPHKKHRVHRTSETEPTVWLAVFYRTPPGDR